MSNLLYRLGRFSASRPWRVIGVWFVAAVMVIGASAALGDELDDSFSAPGVDSDLAMDLLASAESDQAGATT